MKPPQIEPAIAEAAFWSMQMGVIVADSQGLVTFLNDKAAELTGWSWEDAQQQPLDHIFRLFSEEIITAHSQTDEHSQAEDAGDGPEEATLTRRDGQQLPIEYAISSLRDENDRVARLVVVFRDTSDKRLMSLQLARAAFRDPLTGLLNRQAFLGFLADAMNARIARPSRSETDVLVFMDVDQFKLINSTCGHSAGDDLLQWVAALLRESVGARDVLARLGGDEYALLFARAGLDGAIEVIEKIKERLQEFCFSRGDKSFSISASYGVVELTQQFDAVSDLLSAADQACYMAKDRGRGGIQIYQMDDLAVVKRLDEMNWVAHINRELRSGRSRLYAQRIEPLNGGDAEATHFEVLLRLTGEGGQIQNPGDLIRAAERFGLMPSVDRWVIRNTLQMLCEMPDFLRGKGRCFINLSGLTINDESALDFIRGELASSGIPPHKICFEITETVAVENFDQARWFIQELGSIGCRLALDDFGTGAASYGYLRNLPVHYVKIDGSFVDAMATSRLDRAMVESIHQICHLLRIETVAEAVSNADVLDMLRQIGIDFAQGFWLARPQPITELALAIGEPLA